MHTEDRRQARARAARRADTSTAEQLAVLLTGAAILLGFLLL